MTLLFCGGDFCWAMAIEDAKEEFNYIENLNGKKILLKGNHDYWWSTIKKMNTFMKDNDYKTIEFLHNNSFGHNNYIIAGTKGCNEQEENNVGNKILRRELVRLELSIKDGLNMHGENKEIIIFMHYPPFTRNNEFIEIMKKYNVKKCIYGHLHGDALNEAQVGKIEDIEYIVSSCDYTNFKLIKIY